MTDPRSSHDDHDPLRIAAHAAGDASTAGPDGARMIRECRSCAELHADLLALSSAARELPATPRPRDFTISRADADRLRRRGWRRLVPLLAGPGFSLARPLGASLASLGVAGLLLASLPGVPLGGSAAAPGAEVVPTEFFPAAASTEPDTMGGDTSTGGGGRNTVDPQPVQQEGAPAAAGGDPGGERPDTAARDGQLVRHGADTTLAILSGSFLIVGLALLGLRWTAARLDGGG